MKNNNIIDALVAALKARSRPLCFKKMVLHRMTNLVSRAYDKTMFVVDRIISVVFVLVYDMGGLRREIKPSIKALACIYAFHSGNQSLESAEKHYIEKTLIDYEKDRNQISFYYWDENQPLVGMGFNFYKKVVSLNPRYLIMGSYSTSTFYQPMPWILARLKKRNIRIIALWWDTCSVGFVKSIWSVINIIDVHGIMDNPILDLGETPDAQFLKEKSKVFFAPPFQTEVEKKERDIDVAFLGTVSSYRGGRKSYLDFLRDNNVGLYCSTVEGRDQMSHEKYHEILSRCKIGLNLSWSVDRHQLKGRVNEIIFAGGLLMEERNDQTASIFSEGEDYVAFSSKEELLKKIRYYLAHENERKKIVASGQKKARQLYNGKRFWGEVFNS